MITPSWEANDRMWLISKHRELRRRHEQAVAGLKADKEKAAEIRENVIAPAIKIRQENNFSQIIRNSLQLGYDK